MIFCLKVGDNECEVSEVILELKKCQYGVILLKFLEKLLAFLSKVEAKSCKLKQWQKSGEIFSVFFPIIVAYDKFITNNI